jgi:hypothetical protein
MYDTEAGSVVFAAGVDAYHAVRPAVGTEVGG